MDFTRFRQLVHSSDDVTYAKIVTVSIYPENIAVLCRSPKFAGVPNDANAVGKSASFTCGCFVQFSLEIDHATKNILDARYATNGCGYMIAAAECVAREITAKKLTDLGGADGLARSAFSELGNVDAGRTHCLETVAESLKAALADYRKRTIEEFAGEKALICTCFGVSEETIIEVIKTAKAESVTAVSAACNAGSGCGSCQMLIQELIDSRQDSF